jgi:hypothetical protein
MACRQGTDRLEQRFMRNSRRSRKARRASWRRRCNACCKQSPLRYCRNWAVPGKSRCRFHGGMSTGPKTPEGKARVVAAMVEGRRRWVAKMKAEGRKFPGGRKPGQRGALRTMGMQSSTKPYGTTFEKRRTAAVAALGALQECINRRAAHSAERR